MSAHRTYFLHALTPIHPGTGQGIGLIDLPIQRERATRIPLVPGSSVRGVLRDAHQRRHDPGPGEAGEDDLPPSWRLFGPDHLHAHAFASALRISDARTVLFPVPSDTGAFAWVTCPTVLARLARDHRDIDGLDPRAIPVPSRRGECLAARDSAIVASRRAVLDGLPFQAGGDGKAVEAVGRALAARLFPEGAPAAAWWRGHLVSHLAVVTDDLFAWFTQSATDVRAHIRIDRDKGTVAQGALWYEETVPPETVFAGVIQIADNRRVDVEAGWAQVEDLVREPIQVGGRASVGEGLVRFVLSGGDR